MTQEQIKALIIKYHDKGIKMYNESLKAKEDIAMFWDGYSTCATNILIELIAKGE